MSKVILKNVKDTQKHAALLAKKVKAPCMILLTGELGVGKTEWVRSFVRSYLDNKKLIINSPSYSLINEYTKKSKTVIHMDFFRLKDLDDLESVGFSDYLNKKNIICIEWGKNLNFGKYKNRKIINIEISFSKGDERVLNCLF